jgi:hypothetical protein
MIDETDIPYYIALVTEKELENDIVKIWYSVACEIIPGGVRSTVQVTGPDGGRVSVPMMAKQGKGGVRYFIPLTRNLLEFEAEPVVRTLSRRLPDMDFDIMVSKADVEDAPAETKIQLKHEKYDALCQAFAKRQHNQWVEERLKAGWRFATEMSMQNRTSPMLKSWDELPESLRKIDYEHPQAMVDMLSEQGYAVVRKEELAAMFALMTRNI